MDQYASLNPYPNNPGGVNNNMGMGMNPGLGSFPGYIPGTNNLYQPNPLNPLNQNIPNNLNYSFPNQMPFQANYSSGNINPYNNMNALNQIGGGLNPFGGGENFLSQNRNNSMMLNQDFMGQHIQNNANFINQAEIKRDEYIAARMKEREEMKKITNHLRDRLTGKIISNQEILDKEEEEEKKRQEQKEKEQKEDEDKKKKDFREERQKNREMRFNQGLSDQPFEVYIPQSEYFFCRDRAFLNELILAPLKTSGIFGTKYLTDYDKSALFDDKESFNPQNAILLNDEDEYFERAIKDGIYLDYVKQQLFSYNIQKTEQRAFREVKKDWFRPNGDIRMDNDIFADIVTKPIDISLSSNDQFDTFIPNSMFSGRNSSKMRTFKLRIIVGKIIFKAHPCFSEEDKLASELIQCHKDFYSTMNMLNIPYLIEKINNIEAKLNTYNSIHNKTDTQETEIKNMNIFLIEAKNYLAKEKETINKKANILYNKWIELKQLRRQQGHQNTNIRLNVIRFNSSNNNNPNIYDYAFILTNSEVIDTGNQITKEERSRRERVKKNLVHIKVYINGVFAFETKPSEIKWPSYEVEINSQFLMLLYTRPTKFEIELFINNKIVKKFQAEPPGVFSKTVTSSASLMEEIDFGSGDDFFKEEKDQLKQIKEEHNISQKKGLENSEDEKLLIKKDVEDLVVKNEKNETEGGEQIEGSIYIKTEWDGRAPDLPPTKIEDKLELVNKQIEFKELIRKYNDLDYPFDVNDPRNVAFVEEVKKKKLGMMLRFVYKEYLLTYFDVQSTRHYLLLKRLEKRSLHDFKFPILEAQIEKSEKIRKLLEELKIQENYTADEEEERKKKIKQGIDDLKKKFGDIRTDEDYQKFTREKINLMKKDKITQEAYGYPQIISEAEIYSNPILFFKEFFRRVFTRARKLAPLRTKPTPVKVENTNKIKVNIHVVKGYNIPVRVYAYPQAIIDNQKLKSVGCYVQTLRDVFLADNNRLNALRNSQGIQEMAGMNNLMNNSAAFSNRGSNNNSFSLDVNNRNMYGYNPNFADIMHNPNAMGGGRYGGGGEMNEQNVEYNIERLNKMQDERVNSFIEVKVNYYDQEGIFRTDSIASIHPDYNHQFEFYIYPKNGGANFTIEELAKCPGSFYFTLYDEIITAETKTVNATITYTQTKKRKYLGSFQIPFSTVFQNCSVLDTICKINIPNTVFGYYSDPTSIFNIEDTEEDIDEQNPDQIDAQKVNAQFEAMAGIGAVPHFGQQAGTKDIPVEHIINPFLNSYLSLYITLDPVPNFTTMDETSYVSGHEKMLLLNKGTEWLKSLKEKKLYKNRSIRLFAEDFNNSSVFVSRYLVKEGQRPPSLFCDKNDECLIEKIAKYVSLIPFIDDNTAMETAEDMPDCWCTDNEFLTLGFGDYEEHAILLCNYFNYIDIMQETGCTSYLCLGDAHPEGNTVYVVRVTSDFKEVELWNAKTGDCFYFDKHLVDSKLFCCSITQHYKKTKSIFDQICPMKSVGSIISYDNVYVNAQVECDPSLIDFDINKKGNWKPFLDKEISEEFFKGGVKTIQLPLTYSDKYGEHADQIKADIREYLKKQIKEIRLNDNQLMTEGLSGENHKIEGILGKYELYSFTTPKSEINLNKKIKGILGEHNFSSEEFDRRKMEKKKEIRDKLLSDLQELEKEIKDEFNTANEIYGFPINLSYTTKKAIWEQIQLTNVHLIAGAKSQLNLSIYIDPLPNDVYSVWIFLAILNNLNY